jgi:DNA polymerase
LHYGPGAPASAAPSADALEDLWKAYYRSTFNPARLRVRAMKRELPVRHWPTLPEAALIPELIADATARTATMVAHTEGFAQTAADFFPAARDLDSLRAAARGCAACGLCGPATQTVFGEGPPDARIVLVGEQPGDREDREGRPFVGPAGALLDSALDDAGLSRDRVYMTNAVKHFKFEQHEYFRMHHRADVREQAACRPWLVAELDAIDPKVIVCLGATAARAVLGPVYRAADRGAPVPTAWKAQAVPTYHPSAILRHPDPERAEAMRADLVRHLTLARRLAK